MTTRAPAEALESAATQARALSQRAPRPEAPPPGVRPRVPPAPAPVAALLDREGPRAPAVTPWRRGRTAWAPLLTLTPMHPLRRRHRTRPPLTREARAFQGCAAISAT